MKRYFGAAALVFIIAVFPFFNITGCSSAPKTISYPDKTIPVEEQCQLAISPDLIVSVAGAVDENTLRMNPLAILDYMWHGHTNKLYNMPGGSQTLSISYRREGTYSTSSIDEAIKLAYDFYPGKIYLLKYKLNNRIIECWIEEADGLYPGWEKTR